MHLLPTVKKPPLPPRFRDASLIGRGGMGDILLATDTVLERKVAIKVLAERYAGDDDITQRFTREALAAARLSGDPNTVTIFDVGTWGDRSYIVMEYIDGGSLEQVLRGGRPDQADALVWLEQAGRALDAAHADGVVHRDVKPGNLLLDHDGVVRVADFGIASATGLDSLTLAGTVLGTAGYLSPEQARGERATPASDRYGLGVVAFELLTGGRPFAADSPAAEAAAHANAPIPSAREREPALPPDVDAVFRRALAKDPDERYPTCADLVEALRRALARPGEPIAATPPPPPPTAPTRRAVRPPKPPRRPSRAPVWLALAALLAGASLLGAVIAAALSEDDGDSPQATPPAASSPAPEPQPAPEPPPAPEPEPPPPPAAAEAEERGIALTDESTGLNDAGSFELGLARATKAIGLLEQTDNTTYLAYALYNAGNALSRLERCEEALPLLDRSEELQGSQPPIDEARARCSGDD